MNATGQPCALVRVVHFAEFTGDTFYAHTNPVAAAANPLFGGIVAHGYLVVSLAAGLFVDPRPDPSSPTSASTTCGS
jgi:oxepin-CoA hydrolase/3-oxo-5,6-dehydrosuberyl-CoA semialdehyde dehydrogenase